VAQVWQSGLLSDGRAVGSAAPGRMPDRRIGRDAVESESLVLVHPLMLDMWVIFWFVGARVVRVSGSGGGARNVAAAVFAHCC